MRWLSLLAVMCVTGCSLGGLDSGGFTPAQTDAGGDTAGDVRADTQADTGDGADAADADVPDTVCPETNECGGCAVLAGAMGDPCGTCDSGALACAPDNESLRCQGDLGEGARNACLGCDPLDGTLGAPCGTCDGGELSCDGENALLCAGDTLELNACLGCGTLEGEPETPCGTCGSGAWACLGEDVVCEGDRGEEAENACGGCADLQGQPLTSCSDCGEAEWVCSDGGEAVICTGLNVNVCGGCNDLTGMPDDPCGACGTGRLTCIDTETLNCVGDEVANGCMGCGVLEGEPGEPCGNCGEWDCVDTETVVCSGDHERNACDGCAPIAEEVGGPCGTCGTFVCQGLNGVTCNGEHPQNMCGGCAPLQGEPGTACGVCGNGRWVCEGLVVTCVEDGECDSFNLVTVEPGTFVQGTADLNACANAHETQRTTTLTRGFRIGATEVTRATWAAVLDLPTVECPHCPQTNVGYFQALGWLNQASAQLGLTSCYDLSECAGDIAEPCQERCPYVCSSVAYLPDCTGFRLPTEAEWEYASRAGTSTDTYQSNLEYTRECDVDDPALIDIAYYCADELVSVRAVAGRQANAWGLYDTLGNAAEWVFDGFLPYSGGNVMDPVVPIGDARIGVVRGGSVRTQPCHTRCASRASMAPNLGDATVGFRIAQSLGE